MPIFFFFLFELGNKTGHTDSRPGLTLLTDGHLDFLLRYSTEEPPELLLHYTAPSTVEQPHDSSWPQQLPGQQTKKAHSINRRNLFMWEQSKRHLRTLNSVKTHSSHRDWATWIKASLKFSLGLNPLAVDIETPVYKPFWRDWLQPRKTLSAD